MLEALRTLGTADYRSGELEFETLRFLSDFKNEMPIEERDIRKMNVEVKEISWRLRECIRVKKLAAMYRLERMRRVRMLEDQEPWKREAGFDRNGIIAQIDAQRFRTGFDLEPLDTKLYNPRWPHTPEEHTLQMRADVE